MELAHFVTHPRRSRSAPAPGFAASLLRPARMRGCTANHLLAALSDGDHMDWLPGLESVDLRLGQVIYESGQTLSHAYFPTTSMVSLVHMTENGSSIQSALVGNEGMVGIALFMGGNSTSGHAVVSTAGQGVRLSASTLRRAFERCGPFAHLMLRYTQALISQTAQTAVCNRHHSLEQQLCRWLLLSLDRQSSPDLVMTQELIANMLGVRRESVTEAAGKLQRDGMIHYQRGHIKVLDRERLERRTCECYAIVKQEYGRLLPEELAS